MINKDELQAMSDFEVNKALAELLRWEVAEICDKSVLGMTTKFHEKYPNTLWAHKAPNQAWEQICFTHTPDDIMPLAFEYGVYYYNGTACTAISDFIDGHVVFDEPYYFDAGRNLRAIACCLILVLQEKKL